MGKLQDEGINVNLHIPNSHPPSFSTRLNAVDVPAAAAGKNDRSVHLLFQLRQRWRYFFNFLHGSPPHIPPPSFFWRHHLFLTQRRLRGDVRVILVFSALRI